MNFSPPEEFAEPRSPTAKIPVTPNSRWSLLSPNSSNPTVPRFTEYRTFVQHNAETNEEFRDSIKTIDAVEKAWNFIEQNMEQMGKSIKVPLFKAPEAAMHVVKPRPRQAGARSRLALARPSAMKEKPQQREGPGKPGKEKEKEKPAGNSLYPARSSRVGEIYQSDLPDLLSPVERSSDSERFRRAEERIPISEPAYWESSYPQKHIPSVTGRPALDNQETLDVSKFLRPRQAELRRLTAEFQENTVTVETDQKRAFTVHTHVHAEEAEDSDCSINTAALSPVSSRGHPVSRSVEYSLSWQRAPHFPISDWLRDQLTDTETIKRTQKMRREFAKNRSRAGNAGFSRKRGRIPMVTNNGNPQPTINTTMINGMPRAWNSILKHKPELRALHQAYKDAKDQRSRTLAPTENYEFSSTPAYSTAISVAADALMRTEPPAIQFSSNSSALPQPVKPAQHLLASALALLTAPTSKFSTTAMAMKNRKTAKTNNHDNKNSSLSISDFIQDAIDSAEPSKKSRNKRKAESSGVSSSSEGEGRGRAAATAFSSSSVSH